MLRELVPQGQLVMVRFIIDQLPAYEGLAQSAVYLVS
jgi:hypothetical protein